MKTATHSLTFLTAVALTTLVGCETTHQEIGSADHATTQAQANTAKHQGNAPAEMPLPPGMTKADMQACMAAATPGRQQEMLARGAGHWSGTTSMWMTPEAQPMVSKTSADISTIMDGRYVKSEITGDMGMGPFLGLGFNGFDNVSQKYVSTWLDNMGTGIMNGEGTMSADGSTLTWTYHFNCPIQKKLVTLREVQHFTSDNAMTLDMYGEDPHTGKEFKSMHIEMTRQSP